MSDNNKKWEPGDDDWFPVSNDDGNRSALRVHYYFQGHEAAATALGFTSGPDTPLPLKMAAVAADRTSLADHDADVVAELLKVADEPPLVVLIEAKGTVGAPPATIVAHGAVATRPQWALFFIDVLVGRRELTDEDDEGMVGDYEERYRDRVALYGRLRARPWIWARVAHLLADKVHLGQIVEACQKIAALIKLVKDISGN